MTELKNSDIKQMIRGELGLDDQQQLDESFVAQPKQFDIKTERLSDQTKSDHVKLYKDYIDTFNRTSAQLDAVSRKDANAAGSEFRALKKVETYTLNAIYLHELYFANIGDPNSVLYSDTMAHMRLDRDFGGFSRWQDDFLACAMSAREGWVITCFNSFLKRYVNVVIDGDDQGVPLGCFPVVVLDVWAHSYFKDFTVDRKKYAREMMKELNWKVIEDRFIRAERILDALR